MAYINVETEVANYRVILGGHTERTRSRQLQRNCSGVLLEFCSPDLTLISVFTAGKSMLPLDWHCHDDTDYYLLKACRSRMIPIVAAEPCYESLETMNTLVKTSETPALF